MADPESYTRTLSARYYKDGSEILIAQQGKNPRRLTPREFAKIASDNIARRFGYNQEQIKENFDSLLWDTEKKAYKVYQGFEKKYGEEVFNAFAGHLIETGEVTELGQMGKVLGSYLNVFDRFFSVHCPVKKNQSRKLV